MCKFPPEDFNDEDDDDFVENDMDEDEEDYVRK